MERPTRKTRNRRERDEKADRSSVKALKDAEESINDSDAVILKHRVQDKGDQLPEDNLQLLINSQAWVLLVDSGTSMSTLTEGSLNILSAFTDFDIETLTTPYVVTQASGDAVMVSKLARNCTIVLSTGDKKVILPNMTIQIIPGPPDVFLAGLDVVCNRLQVTPLDEQVKQSIHEHHERRSARWVPKVNNDTLVHPDFDVMRELLPPELRPYGVKMLRDNQEIAKDVDVSWFTEKMRFDDDEAAAIEEELDIVCIPSLTDDECIERKRKAAISGMLDRMRSNAREAEVSDEHLKTLEDLIDEYDDIFQIQLRKGMLAADVPPLRIEIREDAKRFPNVRKRTHSPEQRKFAAEEIKTLLEAGILEESTTDEVARHKTKRESLRR